MAAQESMKTAGKTAVVTGVSRGIGLAIARTLLEGGWQVAGWGRRAPTLEAMDHPGFRFFQTDVVDWNSVQAALRATREALGPRVDALVNNAGVAYGGRLADMDPARWREMYDTNVHGLFHCCKVVIPVMLEVGSGHIVNIASLAGKTGSEGLAGYCGSKFAVRGISEALFKELRNDGIKVTCLFPGSVDTEMIRGLAMAPPNPLLPEDVAGAVLFCLETAENCLPSELDLRPARPQGARRPV